MMPIFDAKSETFLTKTEVFDMVFRKKEFSNTFSQLPKLLKSFVKTYVIYAVFDALSNGIV